MVIIFGDPTVGKTAAAMALKKLGYTAVDGDVVLSKFAARDPRFGTAESWEAEENRAYRKQYETMTADFLNKLESADVVLTSLREVGSSEDHIFKFTRGYEAMLSEICKRDDCMEEEALRNHPWLLRYHKTPKAITLPEGVYLTTHSAWRDILQTLGKEKSNG